MPLRLLALAALAAVALPAASQPVLPDSAAVYVSPRLGVVHQSSQGTAFTVGADLGARIRRDTDLGLRISAGDLSTGEAGAFLTVGPMAGYSREIGAGVELDARVLGALTFADLAEGVGNDGFSLQSARGTAQLTLSKPYRLLGSLHLAPTVGAYGTACAYDAVTPSGTCAEAGALVGADLRFRLFGADVSMPIVLPIRMTGGTPAQSLGVFHDSSIPSVGGIRIRF